MKQAKPCVLTINGGSSSIRFAIYDAAGASGRLLDGKLDRIGLSGTTLTVNAVCRDVTAMDHRTAVTFLLEFLETQPVFASVKAVGHRVVHGMKHSEPERITPRLLAELHSITPYAPDHLPREISLIEAFKQSGLPQVACFDTAFHRTMPEVAKLLPLPFHYTKKNVERYGFHGLSFSYLMEELTRLAPREAKGRVILAHLGNGASLAAVYHGKSIDTSMGFTPASGLVMSTRAGDLDPGLIYYFARTEQMTAARFQRMVNHESGLLGISGTSSDVRDLLASESSEPRAVEALDLFCYQAKKWIGSFAAVLGGLDTLVFSAGIGENAPLIRKRICNQLEFIGIQLDQKQNAQNAPLISRGRVKVRVIRTDEERMIARAVTRLLRLKP